MSSSKSDSFNTDIFLKSKKNNTTDINVSSSLFTTSTPSKFNDLTDSAFITRQLIDIHKKLLDSDLIPSHDNKTEQIHSHTNSTDYSQYGGGKYSSGSSPGQSTMELPINYSDISETTDSSAMRSAMKYAYKDISNFE